jgi:hypothetical protein
MQILAVCSGEMLTSGRDLVHVPTEYYHLNSPKLLTYMCCSVADSNCELEVIINDDSNAYSFADQNSSRL